MLAWGNNLPCYQLKNILAMTLLDSLREGQGFADMQVICNTKQVCSETCGMGLVIVAAAAWFHLQNRKRFQLVWPTHERENIQHRIP